MTKNVTITVPVYGDWSSLKDCIESLIKYVKPNHKVMFVNDCGPEVNLLEKNIKKSIKNQSNFEYYRNPKNLGFLQNCNRAVLKLDKSGNDVMLLNSDTKVTDGFLEEMLDVLYGDDKIATVSPRTNNATIATIPIASAKQKGIEPEKSYKLFNEIKNKLPKYNITPVAHGFCILIKRAVIDKFGLFDEAFGKGYGEETDFCMRVATHGHINTISNRSYVFHLEARSFSFEVKNIMLEKNGAIIDQRYPGYRRLVRDYTLRAIEQEEMISKSFIVQLFIRLKRKIKNFAKQNKLIYRVLKKLKTIIK